MIDEVLGPIAGFIIIAWIVWAVLGHLRRNRLLRAQAETRANILNKISAGQEMIDFMKSDAGQRMLEPLPTEPETPREYGRILRSVQAGIVLITFGAGILGAVQAFGGDQDGAIAGTMVMSLGVGFLLAGVASHALARNWGLLNGKSTE